MDGERCLKKADEALSLPKQMWLLGAGISKESGVPTMGPLTKRVALALTGMDQSDFRGILEQLRDGANVEHVLSHLGDLIEMTGRMRTTEIVVGETKRTLQDLVALHAAIQSEICAAVQWGYVSATDAASEVTGTRDDPVVTIENHLDFVSSLFQRRAGLERRPPIAFFTTNYDTLLEDALALLRISYVDGFCGGAMAYWDAGHTGNAFYDPFSGSGGVQSKVYKLHGSVDWFERAEDVVIRRRIGVSYPRDNRGRLVIYPQSSKYLAIGKEPFSSLYSAFRAALSSADVMVVSGYSFGDAHLNDLIEQSLKQRENRLTVLAFVRQPDVKEIPLDQGLPAPLIRWLTSEGAWRERVMVAGSRGFYHGSTENQFPSEPTNPHPWWTFSGLSRFLKNGPEVSK